MEKSRVEVVTKAQMVDHYTQILMKVLGNEKDAQVSTYHISWERCYGFCCHIDEGCAKELADVPGVLSVRPDTNFGSDNKDYKDTALEGTSIMDEWIGNYDILKMMTRPSGHYDILKMMTRPSGSERPSATQIMELLHSGGWTNMKGTKRFLAVDSLNKEGTLVHLANKHLYGKLHIIGIANNGMR